MALEIDIQGMDNKELGQFGEDIAVNFLLNKGYRILGRNYIKIWTSRIKGEIDIVAKKNGIVSFIEVKTSLTSNNFSPEDRVDFKKQRKLARLSQSWLEENNISLESPWQIDVISVVTGAGKDGTSIFHFENIVSEC